MYKLEVYVIDFDNSDKYDIINDIENSRYYSVNVQSHEVADIGEWSDDHELNQGSATSEQFRKYFKEQQ
jgi:hypothetical protein